MKHSERCEIGLEDFVLNPRRVGGQLMAERLVDGEVVPIDVRLYVRTPLIYRGRSVWAHVDACRFGIPAREFCEAVSLREKQYNENPGAEIYAEGR